MESLANVLSQFHSWPLITTPPTQNTHTPRFLFTLLVLNLSSIKTGSTSPGHFDHAVMALVETPNRDAKGTPCRHRVGRSWGVKQGDMEEVYMNIGRYVTTNQPFWTTRPKKTMHMCVYYICTGACFPKDQIVLCKMRNLSRIVSLMTNSSSKSLKLSQSVEWCKKKHAVEIGVYCLCNPSNYNH